MSYRSEYKTLYYRPQHETRNFYLLIYKSEYEKIQAWTDKHQHLETGGDLFGLWASDNTAVVQLVVGPGKNCKRTAASFYQDLDYLERLGNLLTNEEGLCHIGEWHSHHRLSLSWPSGGDEDTVWSNMNRYGLSRFCLLIANIKGHCYRSETTPRDVTVNGFLFEVDANKKRCLPVLKGKFLFLKEDSPLRSKNIDALCKGAEDSLQLYMEQDLQRDVPLNYQAIESELKMHAQKIKKLEESLASERDAREQTERRLQRSEERSRDLETSLTAERQAKEETEGRLQRSELRSRALETSLTAERQAKEKTERRLQRSEQRSRDLETSLTAERQAKEETERKLRCIEQRSLDLETALTAEMEANEETERRLRCIEQKYKQLEETLSEEREERKDVEKQLQRGEMRSVHPGPSFNFAEERNARQLAEGRLRNVKHRPNELETSLVAERKMRIELEERVLRSEQRSRELEASLTAERRAKEDTERQLQSKEQRSSELETSLAKERKALAETEERLRSSEQKSEELKTTLAKADYNLEEYRSSITFCDWILNRNEIALSDKVTGEGGGLGKVIEGTFGGCKVAVKKIHQPISFPDDRDLFQREMSIAFRCRHPCLLEIIGATNDDENPLIVTELMDTNLRTVLGERELEPTEITTIALDVAKGLNYLHLRRPRPIIHGRISSANVLLWGRGSDGWRTKLSDYGTVNFLQQSKNVCPGNDLYSAPEARAQIPIQSSKADVYSFGVLLFEMEIRELPNVVDRDKQIAKVKQHYRRIIRRCMRTKPEDRFNAMADIIEVMEKSQ